MNTLEKVLSTIFAISIILLLCPQSNAQQLSKSLEGDKNKILLELKDVYALQENLFLLPKINHASINENLELALSLEDTPGVVLYDKTGKQVKQIGSIGKGPGEYTTASSVELTEDTLYIWDSNQLKFLKFNTETNSPVLEIKDFRWAVQDFTVVDNSIYFYNSGRIEGSYIEQYNIRDNSYGLKFGERTEAHNLLASYRYAGGIGKRDHYVYFVSPSSLRLSRLNTRSFELDSLRIKDSKFNVPAIEDAREIIMDRDKFREVAGKASRVINLFVMENYVVIATEIGESTFMEEYGGYSAKNRRVRFYIVDKEMNLLDTLTFSVFADSEIQGGKLWGSNENQLFYLSTFNLFGKESPDDPDTPLYYMHIWDLEEVNN